MQVAPALQAAIDAMPAAEIGSETLIVTSHGKPFSAAGFGNKVREWCDAAGLPKCTSHGLRKALARRAADIGTSQQGIKSLGQWSGDEEVKTYVETANRSRLADSALAEVAEWERTSNVV
jgi:integrase